MTPLTALWLPILVSAVLVFIASSIIHMFTKWHVKDYRQLPNDAAFVSAISPLNLPPGDYMSPRPQSTAEMKSHTSWATVTMYSFAPMPSNLGMA